MFFCFFYWGRCLFLHSKIVFVVVLGVDNQISSKGYAIRTIPYAG